MIPQAERVRRRANRQKRLAQACAPAHNYSKHSFCGWHIAGAARGNGHARGWLTAGRSETRGSLLDWLTKRNAREQRQVSITRDIPIKVQREQAPRPRARQTVAGWLRRQANALQRHAHTAMGRLKGRRPQGTCGLGQV